MGHEYWTIKNAQSSALGTQYSCYAMTICLI